MSLDVKVSNSLIVFNCALNLFDFFFKTPFHIEVSPGERLLIVSRKGQGRSSFINMITGFMKRVDGGVRINGEKAFLS